MPQAETKTVWQVRQCEFAVPADSCRIRYGYHDRSTVIMELRGEDIYLCDDREDRYPEKIIFATVPFDLFQAEWPAFVTFMRAKAAEGK